MKTKGEGATKSAPNRQPQRRKASPGLKETDLYPPLKAWLEAGGYTVHAEVGGCDVAAQKGGELILIEMKRAVNLDLLLQVTRRQEAEAAVYAAVPAPKLRSKRWQQLTRLLKRLEAGLLLVHMDSALPRVEVVFHPLPYTQPKPKAAARALLREMNGRSLSLNTGGGNRQKLMTAYRESALAVAAALERTGPTAPKTLRLNGAPKTTQSILTGNHYGWFERLGKALYALTPAGTAALAEPAYAPLVAALRQKRDEGKNP
ncbi:MAG: DUF2161 family putative PD-(D/E)XK-type phosphodiesterase [Candidatus Adiutrix sp.]|nr:DUF2161 family putative PD-(D/E)XK-type phosphodiesterase [Candidatus Adiutrix sp.]